MLQHKADLLQLRTGEALNEFGHGDPVFQVFKQGSHLDPGAANLVPRKIQARFACPGLLSRAVALQRWQPVSANWLVSVLASYLGHPRPSLHFQNSSHHVHAAVEGIDAGFCGGNSRLVVASRGRSRLLWKSGKITWAKQLLGSNR